MLAAKKEVAEIDLDAEVSRSELAKMVIRLFGRWKLSAADQLNKAGHMVTVFERDDKIGGILRYGIPHFKLDKNILDRRIKIW